MKYGNEGLLCLTYQLNNTHTRMYTPTHTHIAYVSDRDGDGAEIV